MREETEASEVSAAAFGQRFCSAGKRAAPSGGVGPHHPARPIGCAAARGRLLCGAVQIPAHGGGVRRAVSSRFRISAATTVAGRMGFHGISPTIVCIRARSTLP